MKHSLTILLLICSTAVITSCKSSKQYQSKNIWSATTSYLPAVNKSPISHSLTLELDSVYRIGSGLKYEGGELVPIPGNSKTVFYSDTDKGINLPTVFSNPSTFLYSGNVTLLKMSPLQPDGSYKFWIDKKAITWTSDSTFVLKLKR